MNTFKFAAIAFMTSITIGFAQEMDQAKKAIDAEQFEKAKSILKSIIQTKPTNGKAAFLLGNIYLTQTAIDSAKISFQNGFEGYVSFVAKNQLIEHYQKSLNAIHFGGQLMIINSLAANLLIEKYFKNE